MKSLSQSYTPKSEEKVEGWVFDLYPANTGEMTVWIKTVQGSCLKVLDRWRPFFYVSASSLARLTELIQYLPKNGSVVGCEFVERFVGLQDPFRSRVLKVTTPDPDSLRFVAGLIWRLGDYGRYRVWNVDLPLEQMFLYDKGLFPLAYVEGNIGEESVSWNVTDNSESLEYRVPPLTEMRLTLTIDSEGEVPDFNDPIDRLVLEYEGEQFRFDSIDEREQILNLVETVRIKDPDVLVTDGGDEFLFTYLARRALHNNVLSSLVLGREDASLNLFQKSGNTYFSYGRVFYRSAPQRLLGRHHIDVGNSGFYAQYGLDGLIEVARTCRVPLHRASRVSIGSCMTSIQLYQAVKDEFLIPWKKTEPENFKSAMDLLVADRGGFYFEPKIGIHDNVGEIDFSSMYPLLMLKKNISPETVGCECCPDSGIRVPELEYNICERRKGIVPKVLKPMLDKRLYYKKQRNRSENFFERLRYDRRQAAYKIILCTSFGYLGYRNARFGKIDAHIAACAFARKALLDTTKLAENRGFETVHGVVDSLYLKKQRVTDHDFMELCNEIEEQIGLPISFEGIYRWIVFLPSRTHLGVPVLNRFYGVFKNGKVKARGVEARRRDTPNIVNQFQNEILQELANAENSEMFYQRIPKAISLRRKYVDKIVNRQVKLEDLVINKRISKNPDDYISNAHQAIAAKQLQRNGVEVSAGQNVEYIILDVGNKRPERRVKAVQLIGGVVHYDVAKYVGLLDDAFHNLLAPFIPLSTLPTSG